ncbi:MAG: DUF3159 domain-containing protein [Microbacteriaceae bacterium]
MSHSVHPEDALSDDHRENSIEEEDSTAVGRSSDAQLGASLRSTLNRSALGAAAQQENPQGSDLLKAVGGIRGLIETTLPPLTFLLVFFLTSQDLVLSVTIPIVVALLFILIRVLTKSELLSSISGLVGLGFSAALALFSGNLENNFLFGIVSNAVLFVVLLISLIIRHPLIGYLGAFLMDAQGWRANATQFRLMNYATIVWLLLCAVRLAFQVPFYLLGDSASLAVTKLVLGVPLYALALWASWLLLRAAFISKQH